MSKFLLKNSEEAVDPRLQLGAVAARSVGRLVPGCHPDYKTLSMPELFKVRLTPTQPQHDIVPSYCR
jgi:hypothetical protein